MGAEDWRIFTDATASLCRFTFGGSTEDPGQELQLRRCLATPEPVAVTGTADRAVGARDPADQRAVAKPLARA